MTTAPATPLQHPDRSPAGGTRATWNTWPSTPHRKRPRVNRAISQGCAPAHARNHTPPHALVVFSDQRSAPWQRLLRTGFRHCFVVVRHGGHWLLCEPLQNQLLVKRLPVGPRFDLAEFYRRRGLTVVCQAQPITVEEAPTLCLLSCVGVVKRALGLCAAEAHTPWQLYRYLGRRAEFSL